MTIERFTTEQFEAALPKHSKTNEPLWKYAGMKFGERVYILWIRPGVSITVRSSIGLDGRAANTGKNSIRCWLIDDYGKPLGSKVHKWTTREPGWQKRLIEQLRILWGWAKKAGNCKECYQPKGVYKTQAGPNKGKIFAKCYHCNTGFEWME